MQGQFKPYKKPESGKLLLSEPFLKDAYFMRSVILLAEHNLEGSFGLILNKPTNLPIYKVVKDFPKIESPVYFGGPVKPESIFYIHSLGHLINDCLPINRNLFLGGDIEQIKELILLNKISPNDIRFFVGYSGWDPKQLDRELKEKSWIVVGYKNINFLDNRTDLLWKDILKNMGDEFAYWATSPLDPALN